MLMPPPVGCHGLAPSAPPAAPLISRGVKCFSSVCAAEAATGLEALQGIQSRELRRQAAKKQLATSAQQLLQEPEKQLSQLKLLLELLQDEDAQVGGASDGWRC